jgi:hypothetical protein
MLHRKTSSEGRGGVTTLVHGVVVAGPIVSSSALVAKNLAAEQALSVLADSANEKSLARLCDCRNAGNLKKSVQMSNISTGLEELSLDVR